MPEMATDIRRKKRPPHQKNARQKKSSKSIDFFLIYSLQFQFTPIYLILI